MPKPRGKIMLSWMILATLIVLLAAAAAIFVYRLNTAKTALAETILAAPQAAAGSSTGSSTAAGSSAGSSIAAAAGSSTGSSSAAVAYTIDERGNPVDDGRAVFINPDTPLVIGSVMKVVVLAAYEQAVEQGVLDPAEPVSLADLERYYLPGADGGAHAAGLASLGLSVDSLGFASDPQASVPLDAVATWMIHYSGNAETDYLIARLGADRLNAVFQAAGMHQSAPIRPILGVSLAMLNHDQPPVTPEQRRTLLRQVTSGDTSTLDQLANRYLTDPDWRAAQIAWMQSPEFTAAVNQMRWEGQVALSHLFPTSTARDYAALMAKIASGRLFSMAVSNRIQHTLETIPTDQPLRLLFHRTYGAKDGLTAGVIALASYAVPKRGPLAGQTRVVVIIANDLTPQVWSTSVQSQSIYLLQPDLAAAAGAYHSLKAEP